MIKFILPTSAVPNEEPNVLDKREEEEYKVDPKEEDEDKSNGEGDETQAAESKDVSNTSEQKMAFTGSVHDVVQDYNCDTADQVFNSKERLKKHMAKKHTQKRKYAGEFRERSFREQKTLRLHFRQDHENESDDEEHEMEVTDDDRNHDENEGDEDDKDQREHDAEDAEVVEGLGDENDVSEKHHFKCKKCDNTSEATKVKENHMDNKLSSYKTRIGSDGNLGYHRKSKRRKVKLKKVDSGNEAEMSGIN